MRFNLLFIALATAATAVVASPLPSPQADVSISRCVAVAHPYPPNPPLQYGGVTQTPPIQGLDAVLAGVQGSLEKLTQFLQGKARRDLPGGDSDQGGGPQDPPELDLQDTLLSSIPELIPLLKALGLNVGNH